MINEKLQKFEGRRQELMQYFHDVEDICKQLELSNDLDTYEAQLKNDQFKVLVLGEFKRGKSTFINALLGDEILPAFATPCTAVINEIKYSEEKKAVLHFLDPLPEPLPELAADVKAHIKKCQNEGTAVLPLEIPIDRIEEFVTIKDLELSQGDAILQSPLQKVEIFWPIEFCQNGVEIIDSPGLNEHRTRTKVTTDYLTQADSVIFVFSCAALASMSELQVIDQNIRAAGYEDIFFICNRFDEVRETEKPRIKEYAQSKLMDKTSLANGIHFLSALQALEAKEMQDSSALEKSGFSRMESALVSFLVCDRGRVKLGRPLRKLQKQINTIMCTVIPQRHALLLEDLQSLEKKYQQAKPKLDEAENRNALMRKELELHADKIEQDAIREFEKFYFELPLHIASYLDEYKLQTEIPMIFNKKEAINEAAKEVMSQAQYITTERLKDWSENTLLPLINKGKEEMVKIATARIGKIEEILTKTKLPQSGRGFEPTGDIDIESSPLPHIFAICAGAVLGFIGWYLIPVACLLGFLTGSWSDSAFQNKLKGKILEIIEENLKKQENENKKKIAAIVKEELSLISDGAVKSMNDSIAIIRSNVEDALNAKKTGSEEVARKRKHLAEVEQSAQKTLDKINDMHDTINA